MKHKLIPHWLKWVFTLFMVIWIPTYTIGYGWTHFLWFSDLFVIMAFIATLFESRFIASMVCVGGLALSALWIIDFLFTLVMFILGHHITGGTAYLFDPALSLWLRLLSLFHLSLPILLLWLVMRLGYDKRAWLPQILLSWGVIPLSWLLSTPQKNINLVYGYEIFSWWQWGAAAYLILGSLCVGLVMFLTHLILQKTLKNRYP